MSWYEDLTVLFDLDSYWKCNLNAAYGETHFGRLITKRRRLITISASTAPAMGRLTFKARIDELLF